MLLVAVLADGAPFLSVRPLDMLLGALVQGVLAGVPQQAAAPVEAHVAAFGGGVLLLLLQLLLLEETLALLHDSHAHGST